MHIEQISVFLENKAGRLSEVTSILAENEINIRGLSLADTSDSTGVEPPPTGTDTSDSTEVAPPPGPDVSDSIEMQAPQPPGADSLGYWESEPPQPSGADTLDYTEIEPSTSDADSLVQPGIGESAPGDTSAAASAETPADSTSGSARIRLRTDS